MLAVARLKAKASALVGHPTSAVLRERISLAKWFFWQMLRRSSHGITVTRHCSLSVRSRLSSTRHSNIRRSQHWAQLSLELLLSWSLQKCLVTRYTQTNTSLWFTQTKLCSIPNTRSSPTDALFYSFWSTELWLLASKGAVCSSTS